MFEVPVPHPCICMPIPCLSDKEVITVTYSNPICNLLLSTVPTSSPVDIHVADNPGKDTVQLDIAWRVSTVNPLIVATQQTPSCKNVATKSLRPLLLRYITVKIYLDISTSHSNSKFLWFLVCWKIYSALCIAQLWWLSYLAVLNPIAQVKIGSANWNKKYIIACSEGLIFRKENMSSEVQWSTGSNFELTYVR